MGVGHFIINCLSVNLSLLKWMVETITEEGSATRVTKIRETKLKSMLQANTCFKFKTHLKTYRFRKQ